MYISDYVCLCEGNSLEAYKGCYGDHHGNKGDGYTHSTNDFQGQLHGFICNLNTDTQYPVINTVIPWPLPPLLHYITLHTGRGKSCRINTPGRG